MKKVILKTVLITGLFVVSGCLNSDKVESKEEFKNEKVALKVFSNNDLSSFRIKMIEAWLSGIDNGDCGIKISRSQGDKIIELAELYNTIFPKMRTPNAFLYPNRPEVKKIAQDIMLDLGKAENIIFELKEMKVINANLCLKNVINEFEALVKLNKATFSGLV